MRGAGRYLGRPRIVQGDGVSDVSLWSHLAFAFFPQFISKRDPEDVKEVRLLGGRGTIPPFQIWKRKGTTGHSARRPAPLPPWPWEEGTLCPVHTHPRTRLGVGRVKRPIPCPPSLIPRPSSLVGGGLEALQRLPQAAWRPGLHSPQPLPPPGGVSRLPPRPGVW